AGALGQAGYAPPQGETECLLAGLWAELLRVDRVGRHDNFFTLGGHSLLLISLVDRLNQVGMFLEIRDIFNKPVLDEMARAITREGYESFKPVQHIMPMRLCKDSHVSLFMIHESTGDITSYRELAHRLAPTISVYGIQPPVKREQPISLRTLSANYVDVITRQQKEGPYFIAGWSGGGHIAYEITRQLFKKGKHVSYLALIDAVLPGKKDAKKILLSKSDEDVQKEILLRLIHNLNKDGTAKIRNILEDHGLAEAVLLMKKDGIFLPDIDMEFLKVKAELTRELSAACLSYIPEIIPSLGKIFLYVGDCTGEADPSHGWAEFLATQLELNIIGGTHTSILEPGYVELLADAMSRDITRQC
ncbi:thioesterase domain-containing protein, partial [Erwinia mallotivora]